MWDLPGPGHEPMSPELAGRFLTTAPPGKSAMSTIVFRLFTGKGLLETVKRVTQACAVCGTHNPGSNLKPPPLVSPVQQRGTYPGEDWQIEFTQMPSFQGFKYLLVFIDTFTGWIEAFPIRTEKATEVAEALLKEIIPRFGLPRHLQSDNGPSFVAKVTQQLSQASGIKYYLHSSGGPQSSGKVEQANHTLKKTLGKLSQETSESWYCLLPIALLRVRAAPKAATKLNPFEMTYGRPFLTLDMLTDPETQAHLRYIINLGQVQRLYKSMATEYSPPQMTVPIAML